MSRVPEQEIIIDMAAPEGLDLSRPEHFDIQMTRNIAVIIGSKINHSLKQFVVSATETQVDDYKQRYPEKYDAIRDSVVERLLGKVTVEGFDIAPRHAAKHPEGWIPLQPAHESLPNSGQLTA